MNPDFHTHAQRGSCQKQRTVKVDDECFTFACQRLAHTKRLDPYLEANPRAPSRFSIRWIGGYSRLLQTGLHTR